MKTPNCAFVPLDPLSRSCISGFFIAASFLDTGYFIGSAFLAKEHDDGLMKWGVLGTRTQNLMLATFVSFGIRRKKGKSLIIVAYNIT